MKTPCLSDSEFTKVQTQLSEILVVMSLQRVRTRKAAERIYWAEWRGLGRPSILAAGSRRMDDFDHPRVARCDATSHATTHKEINR